MSTLTEGWVVEFGVDAPDLGRVLTLEAGLFSSLTVAEAFARMVIGRTAIGLLDAGAPVEDVTPSPAAAHLLDLPLAGWSIAYFDGEDTHDYVKEG